MTSDLQNSLWPETYLQRLEHFLSPSMPHIHSVNSYCCKDKAKQCLCSGELSVSKFSLSDVPEPHKCNKIIMEGEL